METSLEENIFRNIYKTVKEQGKEYSPRGQKTREIINFYQVFPPYVRFPSFKVRKLSTRYISDEFLWYLRADPKDLSIVDKASLWKLFIRKDFTIASNYGVYIFGELNQFDNVVEILKKDPDSRRATMMILSAEHLLDKDSPDFPCTESINFKIRDQKLIMTVHMRSQDCWFGVGSDLPIFSFIQEMVFQTLSEIYPNLQMGEFHHFVESFHYYERHFDKVDEIINGSEFIPVLCPKISSKSEVTFLRNLHIGQVDQVPDDFHFTKWLLM